MDREELITVLEKAFAITGMPCLQKSFIQLKADGELIAELESPWISVEDRLPTEDGWVITWDGENVDREWFWSNTNKFHDHTYGHTTHWQAQP